MTRPSPPLRLICGVVFLGALVSCGGSDATPPEGSDIDRVTVTPTSQEVAIDGAVTFTASVTTGSGDDVTATTPITWSVAPAVVATLVGNGATAIVTGVDEGVATIRAAAGGRSGEASLTVVDPDPPAAPSSVTALAVSDTEIDLTWDDNSDNEDGFRIEREEVASAAPGDGGPARAFSEVATAGTDETSFRDAGLSPGTTYRYVVRACNRNGCTPAEGSGDESGATSGEVVTQETLVVETRSLPPGVQDRAYEQKLSAAGGDGGYAWSVSAGATPAGIELSGSGTLVGTPTEHGTFDFTVEVRSGGQTATAPLALEVQEEIFPPEITTASLPTGVVGRGYEARLEASEGDGQYAFDVVAGSLPPGLTLGQDGSIAGIPSASARSTFTVRVTSAEMTGEADLRIDVHDPLEVTTGTLPSGVAGRSYEARLAASGGDGANAWSLTGGALPDGLGLSPDGTIAGTASTAAPANSGGPLPVTGTFDFSVRVESGDGQTATADLTIEVFEVLAITTTSLPGGEVGTPYSRAVEATGGDGKYFFSAGTLPPGLSIDGSTGEITGTPSAAGTTAFVVTVASGDGQSAQADFSVAIVGPPSITTTSLPDGLVGVAYDATLAATGGDGSSYAWEITADDLPGGLALDGATGRISGIPTNAGTSAFTIQVTSAGRTDARRLDITVDPPAPISLDTEYLEGGNPGTPYSDAVSASGAADIEYSVVAGGLPPGIALDRGTGALTGTPAGAGLHYFTIQAEGGGSTDRKTYAVHISPSPASAFNVWTMNVSADQTIPAPSVIAAVEDALARWEQVISGDFPDVSYPAGYWGAGACGGGAQALNGETFDDMLVMLNLANIDGVGGTLGSAGPCSVRVGAGGSPNVATAFGRLTLDTSDLGDLDAVQTFALAFHEIGHIVGIGTLWETSAFFGGSDLISGSGGPDPRYEGDGGNAEFTGTLGGGSAGAAKAPIEAEGGAGTAYGHWDEGEFDNEVMTGYLEPSGRPMPVSSMTIAAVGDFAYTVNLGAADDYAVPGCAPACTPPATVPAVRPSGAIALDDIRRGPIAAELPSGEVLFFTPRGGRR